MDCQIWFPKAPPTPCSQQDRGLQGTPSTLPRIGEEQHVPLCRDGDDPLSMKSLFIIIIKVEKPKKPDVGPVQLSTGENKQAAASASPGGEKIPDGNMS